MSDPIKLFAELFAKAKLNPAIADATAMALATATKTGMPSVRMVLLKDFDENGFVFYTNLNSRKSLEIKKNNNVALCFYWQPLGYQVRIEGTVSLISDSEADAYYNSRPLISRIGALVSKQSQLIAPHETFLHQIEEAKKIYSEINSPKRPEYWSGWRVFPLKIEFWKEGKFRLHDRELYTRAGNSWKVEKLYP